MIGFVSAITASLAVIILVVISSLIGFVQSIMPSTGLVKVDGQTYRYNQVSPYISQEILRDVVLTINDMSFSDQIKSFQIGCNHGFNASQYEMKHIATYNYIVINKFFAGSYPIDSIKVVSEPNKMNNCFIEIHTFDDVGSGEQAPASSEQPSATLESNKGDSDG